MYNHKSILSYDIPEGRVSIHKLEEAGYIDRWFVSSTFTCKTMECIGFIHARDIFESCIRAIGGEYVYCSISAGMPAIYRNL